MSPLSLYPIASVIFLIMSHQTCAGFLSGNDLLQKCLLDTDRLSCISYVEGISDALESNEVNGYRACVPNRVQAGQIADVVVQFLWANPARRHLGAGGLAAHAIASAFPCR